MHVTASFNNSYTQATKSVFGLGGSQPLDVLHPGTTPSMSHYIAAM